MDALEQNSPNGGGDGDDPTPRANRKRASQQESTTPNVKRRRVVKKEMLSPLSFIATLSPIATPESQSRQNESLAFQLPLKM